VPNIGVKSHFVRVIALTDAHRQPSDCSTEPQSGRYKQNRRWADKENAGATRHV